MQVNKVQQSLITPKTTGYTAATAISLALASGITKNKSLKKIHTFSAWVAGLSTLIHIVQIEYLHHKYKTNTSNN